MSKTLNRQKQTQSLKRYEDGYQSKRANTVHQQRKQQKHFDNALKSKGLHKLMSFEDQF